MLQRAECLRGNHDNIFFKRELKNMGDKDALLLEIANLIN